MKKLTDDTPLILVVDDEDDAARMTVYVLGLAGFLVERVAGGEEALAMMQTQKVDIVVVDLVNRPVDGFELLTRMKAAPALQSIPVLILSERVDDPEIATRLMTLGAAGWVKKSQHNNLVDQIHTILSR